MSNSLQNLISLCFALFQNLEKRKNFSFCFFGSLTVTDCGENESLWCRSWSARRQSSKRRSRSRRETLVVPKSAWRRDTPEKGTRTNHFGSAALARCKTATDSAKRTKYRSWRRNKNWKNIGNFSNRHSSKSTDSGDPWLCLGCPLGQKESLQIRENLVFRRFNENHDFL